MSCTIQTQQFQGRVQVVAEFSVVLDPANTVDDAVNGVYLPQNVLGRWRSTAAYHPKLHTLTYYRNVVSRLQNVNTREQAESALQRIAVELQAGTFPF